MCGTRPSPGTAAARPAAGLRLQQQSRQEPLLRVTAGFAQRKQPPLPRRSLPRRWPGLPSSAPSGVRAEAPVTARGPQRTIVRKEACVSRRSGAAAQRPPQQQEDRRQAATSERCGSTQAAHGVKRSHSRHQVVCELQRLKVLALHWTPARQGARASARMPLHDLA